MRTLYTDELCDLVRWFTYYMSPETRVDLMGDLPQHYALLYPGVSPEIITEQVKRRMEVKRNEGSPLPSLRSPRTGLPD
jgi:hypothetical protein